MQSKNTKIRAIDLFCGVGGLTHGFLLEGLKVNAGIDLDLACKYPYEINNQAQFIGKDVASISGSDLNELFGKSKIRVLAGCAPCQPFSTYAQKYDVKRDDKWSLLKQFSRLIKESSPEIVTMENVPSVYKHEVFDSFVRSLKRRGYYVWHGIVDSSLYGAPQSRKRMVLLASLFGEIKFIDPTQKKQKTVQEVIGRLERIQAGRSSAKDPLHATRSLSQINYERIKASRPGGTWRDWPKQLLLECHKAESGKTFSGVYGRMEWHKPAPTMTTQFYSFGTGRFGHPEQNRAISLREGAIFQGFPRGYKFIRKDDAVNFTALGRMIGNAVPVDLGRAIARSILQHVSEYST
ncbi:DNA cytosine methyltransferase [Polynucleobacter sp. 78F-HAINBA]|jgi:DNA (cytosine-5)-methyltransferase 1|uniref:DNA cytosine methyltransferase n=1 Tax=Polynucleobacter sp. 78F-HAINBA TaxID=2689099 RepID=UPI001C0CE3FA|nr:DNA cytosine methyltransferase [Polynucleobacter sp. 78F-HAINBA]MBU3590424.1 DNA cytosine methyltransferase [Polynucleobacter sp. 78F-HAINBA]